MVASHMVLGCVFGGKAVRGAHLANLLSLVWLVLMLLAVGGCWLLVVGCCGGGDVVRWGALPALLAIGIYRTRPKVGDMVRLL